MSRNEGDARMGIGKRKGPDGEYEIGWGRPPKAFRWKKGQTGKPRRELRRPPKDAELIERLFRRMFAVIEGGEKVRKTGFEIIFAQLMAKESAGDRGAAKTRDRYERFASLTKPRAASSCATLRPNSRTHSLRIAGADARAKAKETPSLARTSADRSRRRGLRSAEGDEAMSDDRQATTARWSASATPARPSTRNSRKETAPICSAAERGPATISPNRCARRFTSKVKIREGGRKRTVTRVEANILALFDKAKRGDAAAARKSSHRPARSLGHGRRRWAVASRSITPCRTPMASTTTASLPKVRRSARHRGAGRPMKLSTSADRRFPSLRNAVHVVARGAARPETAIAFVASAAEAQRGASICDNSHPSRPGK